MKICVATHHPCTHWCCQTILFRTISISLTHFRMICQSEVVIQTPDNYVFAAEFHPASNLTFKFWECKISVCSFTMLTKRAIIFHETFKKICHEGGGLFYSLWFFK